MRRLLYVGFRDNRPFSAAVQDPKYPKSYDEYDIEYSKRDGCYLYDKCGGDSIAKGIWNNEDIYWVAPDIAVRGEDNRQPTRLMELPKTFRTDDADVFFADMVESDAVYCSICDDWFSDEESMPCEHVHWCDECNCYGGSGTDDSKCEHIDA